MAAAPNRRSRKLWFCLLALLPLLGAGPKAPPLPEIPPISQRMNAFTLDLLKQRASVTETSSNTILSPQSIFHGLAMSYIASGGQTRAELGQALHFPADNDALMKALFDLRHEVQLAANHRKIDVSLANAAWLDSTHAEFRKDYVKKAEKYFQASLHAVQFKDAGKVSTEINRWIGQKTHGRIQQSVAPDDFSSRSGLGVVDEPALVTVNAAYFKADWGSQFDKSETGPQPFHLDATQTENAPMMHQKSPLLYAENEQVKFLEIPYIRGTFSMYLILPKEVWPIRKLVESMSAESIAGLRTKAETHQVDVLLPKFEIAEHLGLKDALSGRGVKAAFDKQMADFDRMIVPKFEASRIYISQSYHDAWIQVDEKGTEAAAATSTTHYSISCAAPPRPPPAEFHADHPFVFLIIHNQSRSILFAGWIQKPGGKP